MLDLIELAGPAIAALILGYMWKVERGRNEKLQEVVFRSLRHGPRVANAINDLEDVIRELIGREKKTRADNRFEDSQP